MGANGQDLVLFRPGPKDMLAVFFYMLIMILVHAVIQEFVLDVSSDVGVMSVNKLTSIRLH